VEQLFTVMYPHFHQDDIYIQAPIIYNVKAIFTQPLNTTTRFDILWCWCLVPMMVLVDESRRSGLDSTTRFISNLPGGRLNAPKSPIFL
jgi:hypothetical protein